MKHPISRKEEVEKELELATTELDGGGADYANPDGINELSCSFDTKNLLLKDKQSQILKDKGAG